LHDIKENIDDKAGKEEWGGSSSDEEPESHEADIRMMPQRARSLSEGSE